MANDIIQLLKENGLSQYASVFEDNDIDLETLPHISEVELGALGLSLGHRKKLLHAVAMNAADLRTKVPQAPTAANSEGERRQLTVMFCDLVGSTALSERLDPEDMRDILRAYQQACSDAVASLDGHIAKYIGDGLMIYFGYPQAHEDDPQRAVRAGLGVIAGVAKLEQSLASNHDIKLGVRVAIHTGLVVVGEMGGEGAREQHAIVGETPNIAARLEGIAEPGTLVISDATHRLVDIHFDCMDLGKQRLKGVSRPVGIFQVLQEHPTLSRLAATEKRGMTELIGRDAEIALIVKRWEQAKDAEGQVVMLSGEAGVGKSRILRGFQDCLNPQAYSRILYYGSPYHQNSAFFPVIDQIQRAMRFERGDSSQGKLNKLEATLIDLGIEVSEMAPPLAALLSLNSKDNASLSDTSPQQLKAMISEAIINIIEAMSRQQPVVIVAEDAHWADPSTVELLGLFAERLRNSQVLVLITFRPEFEPPWTGHAHTTALSLNRLSRKEGMKLLAKITGGKSLPDEVVEKIIDRTDGVPLFVEELTKTVLESGLVTKKDDRFVLSGSLSQIAIPSSLHDSLMARLDRLGPVKEVAQLAAVIGRVFEQELLAWVWQGGEAELMSALAKLIEAELIFMRGEQPQASYEFKHALVSDIAYQSLLNSTRHHYHCQIAQAIEERFPERSSTQPELLARHYTEAGLPRLAIPYWLEAAAQAATRSANPDVIAHCERALDLLRDLPKSETRDQQELAALLVLGPALMMSIGFGSSESTRIYERAHELAGQLGNDSALFTVTWGQWLNHQQKAEIELAKVLAEDVGKIALRQGDPEMELQANHASWTTNLMLANHGIVRKCVENGLAIYDAEKHRSHKSRFGGHDPGVCALVHGAMTLWAEGYPDQSVVYKLKAIDLAEKISQPLSTAIAFGMGAFIHQHRGEVIDVLDLSQKTQRMCSEKGIPQYEGVAHILHGWAVASSGESNNGITEMLRGLEIFSKTGSALRRSYYLTLLAEAYENSSQIAKALETIEYAHQAVELVGEQWWRAEVQRVWGNLRLACSPENSGEAEGYFMRAIEVARAQNAKSFELRAATSLAHLWVKHDRGEEARNLLNPVYEWFTEGFETADLRNAKQMIETLS